MHDDAQPAMQPMHASCNMSMAFALSCDTSYSVTEQLKCRVRSHLYADLSFDHRYLTDSHISDFLADNSNRTAWQSDEGATPVNVILGFDTPTTISKVFILFISPLPMSAMLEFFQTSSGSWIGLQYFALDCNSSFGMEPNQMCVTKYIHMISYVPLGSKGK